MLSYDDLPAEKRRIVEEAAREASRAECAEKLAREAYRTDPEISVQAVEEMKIHRSNARRLFQEAYGT